MFRQYTRSRVGTATTKHTCGGPVFGKLAPRGECRRCDQLHSGSAPIQWVGQRRTRTDALQIAEIRAHDCKASKCSIVCTFGDW